MEQNNRSLVSKDELDKFLIALINSNQESKNKFSFYKDEKPLRIGENITQENPTNYDSVGAASFCIVVIVWYFFGVVAFVTWQMKKKQMPQTDYKTELLSIGLEDQVKTKLILEELRNPNMRTWAWKIYGIDSNKKVSKSRFNQKYEKQVVANLNKRLIQIEKEKQKLQDQIMDEFVSQVDTVDFNNLKRNFEDQIKQEQDAIQYFSTKTYFNHENESKKSSGLLEKYLKKKTKTNNSKDCKYLDNEIEFKV